MREFEPRIYGLISKIVEYFQLLSCKFGPSPYEMCTVLHCLTLW